MHVRHLNSYFFSNRLHHVLVEKLADSGIQQQVFVPLPTGDLSQPNSVNHVDFAVKPCFNKFQRHLWPLKMSRIWSVFKETYGNSSTDIHHAHSLFVNGLLGLMAKRKYGIPYVVTVRNTDINYFLGRQPVIFRPLGWRILREASAVITLSSVYLDQLKKIYEHYPLHENSQLLTIPNGCEDFWYEDAFPPRKAPASPLRLVFVGLLSRNKNLPAVLSAVKTLHESGLSVDLKVVGSGPLESTYRQAAEGLPVQFLGFIEDRIRLRVIYRDSDVLVVPSFTESFGVVYAEALTQGLPVIYSRGQGFDGFFEDGCVGRAVNPNHPEELISAIKDIQERYTQMSYSACEGSAKFQWDHSTSALCDLYKSIIRDH